MTGSVASPRCSIVIRAYNEEKPMERLLAGIQQQTLKEVEVILVDSGSLDNTVDVATRQRARLVHISPEEFTFGRSLNLGISHAHSEFIIIASAHVYPVYPDWLEHLLAPFTDPQVALSYGKQRGNLAAHFSEQQIFQHWYSDQSQPQQAHPFCNNANAAIRRSLWLEHPYDETLSGLEDIAWAKWAIEQGHILAYTAEAEVIHVHSETPCVVYNRYQREAMAFKRLFPHEYFSLTDFLRLVISNIASDLWHATLQKTLTASLSSIFWFRWSQFWGTYQGYRRSGPLTQELRQTFYYPQGTKPFKPPLKREVTPIRYQE
jgi:glycosyltransferase involved in cell wall biosynthesis